MDMNDFDFSQLFQDMPEEDRRELGKLIGITKKYSEHMEKIFKATDCTPQMLAVNLYSMVKEVGGFFVEQMGNSPNVRKAHVKAAKTFFNYNIMSATSLKAQALYSWDEDKITEFEDSFLKFIGEE